MYFLDSRTISVECHMCHFSTDVTFREVRLRSAIICRGCKATLQLEDYMCSMTNAQKSINRSLLKLKESLGKKNITLEL